MSADFFCYFRPKSKFLEIFEKLTIVVPKNSRDGAFLPRANFQLFFPLRIYTRPFHTLNEHLLRVSKGWIFRRGKKNREYNENDTGAGAYKDGPEI